MAQKDLYSKVATFTLVVGLLLNIWGCGEKHVAILDLVPERGSMLLNIDLPIVAQDSDLSQIVNIDDLRLSLNEIQINPKTVTQLVAFGDLRIQSRGEDYYGMILQGNYNAKRKLQDLERSGWKKDHYAGSDLYYQSGSKEYMSSLKKDAIGFGTLDAIKDILDVKNGRKKPATSLSVCSKLLSCSSGSHAPVMIYMIVPQNTLDIGYAGMEMLGTGLNLIGVGAIGTIMGKIGLVHGLSMSINHSRDVFPVELSCMMQNETAASLISGSLNLLKSITSMIPSNQMSPQDRQNMESFNSIRISRNEKVLIVNMIMPHDGFR